MDLNNGRTYFLGEGGKTDLTVRVSIRRVPPINDDASDNSCTETKTKTIAWQEKILDPRERIAAAMIDTKLSKEMSDTSHLGIDCRSLQMILYPVCDPKTSQVHLLFTPQQL